MRLINPKSRKVSLPAKTAVAFFGAVVFLTPIFSFAQTAKIIGQEIYKSSPEILEKRNNNYQIFQNADGSFTMKLYNGVMFVKQGNNFIEYLDPAKQHDTAIEKLVLKIIPEALADIATSSVNNADSFVVQDTGGGGGSTNYGSNDTIYSTRCGTSCSNPQSSQFLYIKFTLPENPVPCSFINSTKLYLDKIVDNGTLATDYQLFENTASWIENTITWNNKPTASATIIDQASSTNSVSGWKNWTLYGTGADNTLEKTWTETYDLVLKPYPLTYTGADYKQEGYASKENATTANRPYLEINYQEVQCETGGTATTTELTTEATSTQQIAYYKMFIFDLGIIFSIAFLVFKFLA